MQLKQALALQEVRKNVNIGFSFNYDSFKTLMILTMNLFSYDAQLTSTLLLWAFLSYVKKNMPTIKK